MLRSAKEAENFPYKMSTICYIEVDKNGNVSKVPHKNKSDLPLVAAALERVKDNKSALYAVWPGNWSSDLFIIDDLKALADSFNIL